MSIKEKSVRSASLASKDRLSFLDRLPSESGRRARSHSQSLVHAPAGDRRSISDINDEIRSLEAERRHRAREHELRGFRDELKAEEEFALADKYRDHRHHHHRHPHVGRDELVVYDRSRSRSRPQYTDEEVVLFDRERERRRDELVVYDEYGRPTYYKKERSPPRNVVRVEKDRKGRMSLVRSTH